MSSMQWKQGTVSVINGSAVVLGNGTSWINSISPGNVFKLNIDGDTAYIIGSIDSDSQITLTSIYEGATAPAQAYVIQRDFSVNRGYALPNQGEAGIMDILREKTINKIDADVAALLRNFLTVAATTPGNVVKKIEVFDENGISQGFMAVYDAIS